jgi:hypothetical protein
MDSLLPDIETFKPDPAWSFVGASWHFISPWQSQLRAAGGTRVLRELVSAALAHAASLAADRL